MVIALDSNVFIAALSSHEKHSSEAQKLIRDVASGKHRAIASSIVYGEVYSISIARQPLDLEDFISHIDNLETVPAADDICSRAGKLRLDYGPKLKLPDALHLATALNCKANLFITNDAVLAKLANKFIASRLLSESS